MTASATIACAQSLVPQGVPDLVTIVWSGTASQKVAAVGWLSKPPNWTSLDTLVGQTCVNGASGRLQFKAIFESPASLRDASGILITQSVQPWLQLDDGTMVVPGNPSNLPPVSPAYPNGTNPPTVVALPSIIADFPTYIAGGTRFMDLNNTANWVALGN